MKTPNSIALPTTFFVALATLLGLLCPSAPAACTPPLPGLVAWFPGDNTPNDIIGGNGNDFTGEINDQNSF